MGSSSLIFPYKKLIVFLNLLMMLWQSGRDFKFQSSAQSAGELSRAEVSSINTVVNKLKPRVVTPTITKSYCFNAESNYGFSIDCVCNQGEPCQASSINKILFSDMGSTGTIDEAIGDLTELVIINLSNNKLHGPIPISLGNLVKLQTLDLSYNQLSGTIPDSLGNLQSLRYLYLKYNFLEGTIPSTLGQTSLVHLYLDYNRLSGSIPKELGQLQSLTYLQLSENGLNGKLPWELGNLTNLLAFWMPSNYFVGDVPKSYENLNNLRWFGVAGNRLQGPLPYIANWTKIESLWLQGNNFEGPLQNVYFEMSDLEQLLVSDLRGTGETKFPPSVKFTNMNRLVLRRCLLSGPIPEFIGELSALKHLDLSFNKLTGGIPESMRPNLFYLSLARNNLSGTIPNWIFQATGTRMDLSHNNLSKLDTPVPSELDLNLFSCCCCEVSQGGTEPYMLQLPDMMKSYFPRKKPKFYSLYINSGGEETNSNGTHYEADNSTSPFYTSPAKNWAYSFSGDFLSATANSSDYTKRIACRVSNSETSLYDDARLSPVSLDYYGFGLYKGNYSVTLHFAEIIYSDAGDYGVLKKRMFDIYIQDKLETPDFNIKDRAGGPNKATTLNFDTEVNESSLLHIHLYWAGKGSYLYPPAFNGPLVSAISVDPKFKVGNGKLSAWKIALITLASLVLALLILLAIAWSLGWFENKELKKKVKVKELTSGDNAKEDVTVTLKQLVKVTGDFSNENKLGSGYLGAVYWAKVMDSPEIKVAVKKIYPRHKGKISGTIQKEIYLLKALEGQNIVKLLDVHIGESLQLFIYEYMEKGSLETALFNSKVETIQWNTRFEICKGIAAGLASLHQRSTSVVHGNLKASSILLDSYNKPKLSDFGYASIYSEEDKFSLIKQSGASGVFAPEYCQGRDNALSAKTDIYSFGVILLEIVAGHANKECKGAQETIDLLDKVQLHFQGKKPSISGFIDKKLKGNKELNEREVELVLELAVMCTSSPSVRPWMHDVLSVLNGEKKLDEIRPVEIPSPSNSVDDTAKSSASTSSSK